MSPIIQDIASAVALLVVLLLALEMGFRYGKRDAAKARDARVGGQVGAVQGAVLGLLALLLGFSFAAAGSRFLERQELITTDANAIGTAYLRADLLPEPSRTRLRTTLKQYTAHRVEVARRARDGTSDADATKVADFHAAMWAATREGVAARPEVAVLVVPAVNDVIDTHSVRMSAAFKRLPTVVIALLIGSAILSIGDIGYGSGLTGRRRFPLTMPLALIVGLALWITIDLDHPRAGLLQLNDAPMEQLRFDDTPPPPAPQHPRAAP